MNKSSSTDEILKALNGKIERVKQALGGIDRKADLKNYRSTRKRLKRAQRRLHSWNQISARLEKRRKAGKAASPKPAAATEKKTTTRSAEKPAPTESAAT